MSRSIRANFEQQFLLPPTLEDWIAADHPTRFIRDFVSSLDFKALGFVQGDAEPGRPRYAAELLLGVWIYGYFERIRTARKLEHACRTHLPLIWLTGMHYPDHNTLWRFWRDNKPALRRVFKQSVRVAQDMGLVGMVTHAVDGTRIAVHSSIQGALHRSTLEAQKARIEASIAAMEAEVEGHADAVDAPEALPESLQEARERKAAIEAALASLDAEDAKHLLPAEPEARMMQSHGHPQWSYNAQAVMDAANGIVVAQEVTNEATDYRQLAPMVDAAHENTGAFAQHTVADAGYRNTEQEQQAQAKGHTVVLPAHGNEADDGSPFHRSQFQYDAERDCYTCPQGQALPYDRTMPQRGTRPSFKVYRCRCYQTCPVREQCSRARYGRTIVQHPQHEYQAQPRRERQRPEIQKLIRQRKVIVEPLFGWIKQNEGFRRWTAKGLANARAQWDMLCLTMNLRKMHAIR